MAKVNNEKVAIKKVLEDKRFKNRELDIMRMTQHPNVVSLKYFFYSDGPASSMDPVLSFLY